MNIYQKLHKIQSAILGLGKDKKGNNYEYVTGNKVLSEIKPLKEAQKAIEDQIKMATKVGKSFVDESTGELISPVTKTSTTTPKITLSK